MRAHIRQDLIARFMIYGRFLVVFLYRLDRFLAGRVGSG